MVSEDRIVDEAIPANKRMVTNSGFIDYSSTPPRDRYEVLEDLDTIGGTSPDDIEDLRTIKPYAKKFGVLAEFNEHCIRLGVRV